MFYCKHVLKWYSSKSPNGFTEYWVFTVHLKRAFLLFWLLVAKAYQCYGNCCEAEIIQKSNTKKKKQLKILHITIVVLFRWTNRTQYLIRHFKNLNYLFRWETENKQQSFPSNIGIYFFIYFMYISLQFSPVARSLLVKWTLCRVKYISRLEKATRTIWDIIYLKKQKTKTSGKKEHPVWKC